MSNKSNRILKATENFESFIIKRFAGAPLIAGAAIMEIVGYVGAAMFVGAITGKIVDDIQSTTNLIDDADKMLKNLTEYKEDYEDEEWFAPFKSEYDEFLSCLKTLKDLGQKILNASKSNSSDPSLISDVQKYLETLPAAERLAPAVNAFLEDNKNILGSKSVDKLKYFGLNLGMDTDAGAAQEGIMSFYQHAQYERVRLEKMLKDLQEKAKNASPKENKDETSEQPHAKFKSLKQTSQQTPRRENSSENQISSIKDYADLLV